MKTIKKPTVLLERFPYRYVQVGTLEINGSYIDAPICGSGEPNSSDLVPAGLRWSGRAADDNYGLYFEYRAPSKSSVIFN